MAVGVRAATGADRRLVLVRPGDERSAVAPAADGRLGGRVAGRVAGGASDVRVPGRAGRLAGLFVEAGRPASRVGRGMSCATAAAASAGARGLVDRAGGFFPPESPAPFFLVPGVDRCLVLMPDSAIRLSPFGRMLPCTAFHYGPDTTSLFAPTASHSRNLLRIHGPNVQLNDQMMG